MKHSRSTKYLQGKEKGNYKLKQLDIKMSQMFKLTPQARLEEEINQEHLQEEEPMSVDIEPEKIEVQEDEPNS